jgi:IclR helix-turn-helix domain
MREDAQKSMQHSNIWDTPQASSDPGISPSLERGLAILSVFTRDRAALGVSELARELSLTRSTTHRYVATSPGSAIFIRTT